MARKFASKLDYCAIRIVGGLIPAAELARLTTLTEPGKVEQTESHYRIPKGLKLCEEIARSFTIKTPVQMVRRAFSFMSKARTVAATWKRPRHLANGGLIRAVFEDAETKHRIVLDE